MSNGQDTIEIPRAQYEELRAKAKPNWYKRHMTSLVLSGAFSLVVALAGYFLDQRSETRIRSMEESIGLMKTEVDGFKGQLELVGDRLQSMGNRIQSMDTRLIQVQVNVGTIEGALGKRLGYKENPTETPVPTGDLPHTTEVPSLNHTNPVLQGTHRQVSSLPHASHRQELVH